MKHAFMSPHSSLLRSAFFILCSAAFFAAGCSENPFGGDKNEISTGAREVRGTVQLNDRADPAGAVVWLENFNLATRADANGNFALLLPPPGAQGAGNGATGLFNLYFYVANYELTAAQVATRNGAFVYAQAGIGPTGNLNHPSFLRKFLRIETRVTPGIVRANRLDPIEVMLTLQALADTVSVIFPHTLRASDWIGALIIRSLTSPNVYLFRTVPTSDYHEAAFLNTSIHVRQCTFSLATLPLPPGDYEVIPYFLIRHDPLPTGLRAALGPNLETPGANYLQIPMRREGGRLQVTP